MVDDRPAGAEVGDGGVVVGQPFPDRQRLAVRGLRLRRSARRNTLPRLFSLTASLLRKFVTAGWLATNFSRIASALRCATSAPDRLPDASSTRPRLLWMPASRSRNSVLAGFSATTLSMIASATRVSASASGNLPVSKSRRPMYMTVSARSLRASFEAPGAFASTSRSARARR